jgi:hypothetical protein
VPGFRLRTAAPIYVLGNNIHRVTGPLGIASVVLASAAILTSLVILRRREAQLAAEAERALPGPLDAALGTPR